MAGVAHVAAFHHQARRELVLDVEVVGIHVAVAAGQVVIAADAAGEFGGGGEQFGEQARRLVRQIDHRALHEEGSVLVMLPSVAPPVLSSEKTPTPVRMTVFCERR